VSGVVNSDSQINNNSILNYKIKVGNRGDVPSTLAKVVSSYDLAHLDILDAEGPYTVNDSGNLVFNLGTLDPGQEKEINFRAKVKNTNPGDQVTNTFSASQKEKDTNDADNNFNLSVNTFVPTPTNYGFNNFTLPPEQPNPNTDQNLLINNQTFAVSREVKDSNLSDMSQKVHARVTLHNLTNNKIDKAIFIDILRDPTGKEIERQSWDLGDIAAREEITLDYDISFVDSAISGVYILSSELNFANNGSIIFENNGSINVKNIYLQNYEKVINQEKSTKPKVSNILPRLSVASREAQSGGY
jgi:hypothetical protein